MNDATDQTQQSQVADDAELQDATAAAQAVAAARQNASDSTQPQSGDEVAASDQLAETLGSLQNVIERNAQQLEKIKQELKEVNNSIRNVFDNDVQLSEAQEQAQLHTTQVKERKSQLKNNPQVTSLQVKAGELKERKKEIEEALSNHLVNYYQLTNSKSFDTSEGDQWEFDVRAKVKGKPRSN